MPTRMALSARYLFTTDFEPGGVSAYDTTSDEPACVWSLATDQLDTWGLAVALQDSVLIVAQLRQRALLPIDIRADTPAHWRCGAPVHGKDAGLTGDADEFAPMEVVCDAGVGRLFVIDRGSGDALRIFDVAMQATAAAGPLAVDGTALIALTPIALLTSNHTKLEYMCAVAVAVAVGAPNANPNPHALRVFVGASRTTKMVELTADGTGEVQPFWVDGAGPVTALTVANGRLFIVTDTRMDVVPVMDLPDQKLKAWTPMGCPPSCANVELHTSSVCVVDGLLLMLVDHQSRIEVVPLAAPFV
jgi:hypothetical protein